ncbi:holin [Carnobacterium divergens]|uniref:phage holin family protein n=1 Tax=Carnobacterium divergens TaxID=2748 RepID=UPI000D1FE2DC|nr:phage holin family protein [Carnobacterium divergens]MCO6017487.1 phage holin family protein [Carnobacterium divergens]TFI61084.1 holin [Carnobacterium divergens]TFI88106.1 holin [Carnobacterium divergens]TFJ02674.1 holin [Carnobacterium divergens]TFJ04184.1 holin [Carnobacterium divergens]
MQFINHLLEFIFKGGSPVMSLYLTALLLDLVTGYIKALKDHNWRSALNIEGLLIKFVTFFTIIAAGIIDDLAPLMSISIPINIAFWWTIILTIYELGSILENMGEMGVNIGFLKKYLGILQDTIENKEDEK